MKLAEVRDLPGGNDDKEKVLKEFQDNLGNISSLIIVSLDRDGLHKHGWAYDSSSHMELIGMLYASIAKLLDDMKIYSNVD
jgi:hypothetical protein